MEAVEEPPLPNAPVDGMKITVIFDENDESAAASVASDVCQKSNGVADSESVEVAIVESISAPNEDNKCEIETSTDVKHEAQESIEDTVIIASLNIDTTDTTKQNKESTNNPSSTVIESSTNQVDITEINTCSKEIHVEASVVEVDSVVEPLMERVTFQTEIVVETNDNEVIETVTDETPEEQDSNNLLSEIYSDQSIELSEVLRSSDVTDNVENNNCAVRQEVFNKEELLDILEGNDEERAENILLNKRSKKILETQLALQQLSRLKRTSNKKRNLDRLPKSRKSDKKVINQQNLAKQEESEAADVKNEKNIVNSLVQEWDDEEASELEKSHELLEDTKNLITSANEVIKAETSISNEKEGENVSARTSVDSSTDGKTSALNKSSEEGQPQRRLGRVIKKKVIFDPDNPDTFTKSKIINKNKDPNLEIDQTPSKKIKTDQNFQRSKSKSPLSKLQWKKPSPKTCKQNKRLTEIDKLLMDEGAVNMIYQLTPEAPKGKKNMKTKAEFIKKIQSSTPDSKEMKFRERKKESKHEDGEARKILGGKQRPSLNSSVKSPSVCEDFEAHSADDSIIYRRHSSSSYSSSCMSPRRLSDVEANIQSALRNVPQAEVPNQTSAEGISTRPVIEVFMSESTDGIKPNTINKDDCMSIKEKLNSKLNLALNKRKRDNSSKVEKPPKVKRVIKSEEKTYNSEDFKHLSINFDQRFAEIHVTKPGTKCNIQLIKELEKALQLIDLRKNISVTLLSAECGTTYSDLDLRPLLDGNIDTTTNFAYEMAESIRSLLHTVEQHSKLLCSGISGRCSGIGLALIGLSDVALASERASFAITPKSHVVAAPVEPGVSVFTTYRLLPQPLLNDLIVFGRQLSASEAMHGGLVSRTLWPENFNEQVLTIVKDIAAQPAQNVWLKKQLLSMKKHGAESAFLSYLKRERDLLVEYWTSVEGQEIIRELYNAT